MRRVTARWLGCSGIAVAADKTQQHQVWLLPTINASTHTHTYIYTYVYICDCKCVYNIREGCFKAEASRRVALCMCCIAYCNASIQDENRFITGNMHCVAGNGYAPTASKQQQPQLKRAQRISRRRSTDVHCPLPLELHSSAVLHHLASRRTAQPTRRVSAVLPVQQLNRCQCLFLKQMQSNSTEGTSTHAHIHLNGYQFIYIHTHIPTYKTPYTTTPATACATRPGPP